MVTVDELCVTLNVPCGVKVGDWTVKVVVPVTLLKTALTVIEPTATQVNVGPLFVATELLDEDHATCVVISAVLPFE